MTNPDAPAHLKRRRITNGAIARITKEKDLRNWVPKFPDNVLSNCGIHSGLDIYAGVEATITD
jgi:hypothetical protein